jgi:hypothetical protein
VGEIDGEEPPVVGSPELRHAEIAETTGAEHVEPPWTDLALNRPGERARRQALDRRRKAPVKTALARVLRVHTEERAWRVGADGEEEVARRLRKLPDAWHVVHAVPVGERDSDIDHVVIGPAGVFTLNTKNHSRAKVWVAERSFLVNGLRTDYLRNARHEAARASRLLSTACAMDVSVEPVIVVLAAELTIKAPLDGVHVVARRKIARWLARRPARLTRDEVARVYEQARRSTVWQPERR